MQSPKKIETPKKKPKIHEKPTIISSGYSHSNIMVNECKGLVCTVNMFVGCQLYSILLYSRMLKSMIGDKPCQTLLVAITRISS